MLGTNAHVEPSNSRRCPDKRRRRSHTNPKVITASRPTGTSSAYPTYNVRWPANGAGAETPEPRDGLPDTGAAGAVITPKPAPAIAATGRAEPSARYRPKCSTVSPGTSVQ